MTAYQRRRFSVAAPGTDQYRDNYDRTFGSKTQESPTEGSHLPRELLDLLKTRAVEVVARGFERALQDGKIAARLSGHHPSPSATARPNRAVGAGALVWDLLDELDTHVTCDVAYEDGLERFMKLQARAVALGFDVPHRDFQPPAPAHGPQHRHGGVTTCTAPSSTGLGEAGCTCLVEEPNPTTTKHRAQLALEALDLADCLLGEFQRAHRLDDGHAFDAVLAVRAFDAVLAVRKAREELMQGAFAMDAAQAHRQQDADDGKTVELRLLDRLLKVVEREWGPLMEIDDVRLDQLERAWGEALGLRKEAIHL